MKIKAFGAIDLLVSLLLISIIFIVSMGAFKSSQNAQIQETKDLKSVQEKVNSQITEIENLRQNAKETEKNILDY